MPARAGRVEGFTTAMKTWAANKITVTTIAGACNPPSPPDLHDTMPVTTTETSETVSAQAKTF
jgi:hypothetical protein